ncbi:MAG TPA: sugar phosphate isomerase/epimerase, partial [Acholeplasmataceae bacterium]|nr:sugar phosphate isomerase/epimerase [Acholeplasmataceae bacterium]
LYNFLNIENYVNRMDIFQESLDLLSEHIVIFHLKDFIVENGKLKQVGLGQGLMDYPKIINLIKEYNPNAYLIFEGVVGEDIKTSFELINNLINGGRN